MAPSGNYGSMFYDHRNCHLTTGWHLSLLYPACQIWLVRLFLLNDGTLSSPVISSRGKNYSNTPGPLFLILCLKLFQLSKDGLKPEVIDHAYTLFFPVRTQIELSQLFASYWCWCVSQRAGCLLCFRKSYYIANRA